MGSNEAEGFRVHPIEWDDIKVSRLWDYYSRTPPYSDLYVAKRFGDRILRESGLPLRKPVKVLDFGCGPGFMWDHLVALRCPWEYTAVDFSESSVEAIARRTEGDPRCAGAHHITHLPTNLIAESFDAILLLEVVEHLNDEHLEKTLGEMRRLLKRGGALVVTTPNEEDLSESMRFCPECGAVFHQWQHVRTWSVSTLMDKLGHYGFELDNRRMLNVEPGGVRGRLIRLMKTAIGSTSIKPHLLTKFVRN